jgi:PPM family protein phosphatase
VPVPVLCPHCGSPCLLAEQHLGVTLQCAKCGNLFAAQAPPAVPRLDVGSATSPGRVRSRNEDSFLVQHLTWSNLNERHEIALVVVADGMGGHDAGDRASGLVTRTVSGSLAALLGGALSGQFKGATPPVLAGTLAYALQEANRGVLAQARGEPACKGMGATAAVVLVWDGLVLVGHVGDCRVYHQHAGRLTRVTKDQTLVARMVELGTLSPKEALHHPARNEVYQAIGRQPVLEPAAHQLRVVPGDWLLVACDGLHAHLDDPALQAEVGKAAPSAGVLAQQLVDLVNQRGGSDNCTVVAVRCW